MNVSTSELAEALHVDKSLVSKWRNNRRELSAKSIHIIPLCNYLLAIEEKNHLNVLDPILKSFEPEADLENLETKMNCLCRWLTSLKPVDPPIINSISSITYSYESITRVWDGLSGRQEAVLFFLDQVLLLPNPTRLFLVSQEDISWMTENLDFLQKWQKKLMAVLSRGHEIKIIHWVDRSTNIINSIVKYWLPLHLTGQIQSWCAPIYVDLPYKMTMFIADKKMVLTGISTPMAPKKITTNLAVDAGTIEQYTIIFNSLIRQYQGFVNVVTFDHLLDLFNITPGTIDNKTKLSCSFNIPPLFIMSQDLLSEILRNDDITAKEQEKVMSFHKQFICAFSTYFCSKSIPIHCMIDEENLQKYILQRDFISPELTFLLGKPVNLRKEYRIKHILEINDMVENNQALELGLLNSTNNLANLVAFLNHEVIAWSQLPQYHYALSAIESTVVDSCYKYLETCWYSIPRIKRSKEDVLGRIKLLLDE